MIAPAKATVLVAAALLASAAWSQTLVLQQSSEGAIKVASEYFGAAETARPLAVAGRRPQIVLTADLLEGRGVYSILESNSAEITFTLNGATFNASVGLESFQAMRGTGSSDARLRYVSGGAIGDRSVTFLVTVGADGFGADYSDRNNPVRDRLVFSLPDLLLSPVVANPGAAPAAQQRVVTATATITRKNFRGSRAFFPSKVAGTGLDSAGDRAVNPAADGVLVRLAPAVSVTASGGADALVSASGDRRQFMETGGAVPVRLGTGAVPTLALLVTELRVVLDLSVRRLDANASVFAGGRLHSSLNGSLQVGLAGPFEEGAVAYTKFGNEAPKALAMAESGGMASGSLSLGAVGDTAARVQPIQVLYVPGGETALWPATFTASAALSFNDPLQASQSSASGAASISYHGISTAAYAYDVRVGENGTAGSILRLGCANVAAPDTACSIFASCRDEVGNSYFGELSPVPRNATGVYSGADVARSLPNGGWDEGGVSCLLLSNGALEAQHLRAAGDGPAINNSNVVGAASGGNIGILAK